MYCTSSFLPLVTCQTEKYGKLKTQKSGQALSSSYISVSWSISKRFLPISFFSNVVIMHIICFCILKEDAYRTLHLVYSLCKNTMKNKKDQTVKEKIQITKRLTKGSPRDKCFKLQLQEQRGTYFPERMSCRSCNTNRYLTNKNTKSKVSLVQSSQHQSGKISQLTK